jgi:hypothetical protein
MTESELKSHKVAMEEARREFYQYFTPECNKNGFKSGLTHIAVERLCWEFFLHGKGLKK